MSPSRFPRSGQPQGTRGWDSATPALSLRPCALPVPQQRDSGEVWEPTPRRCEQLGPGQPGAGAGRRCRCERGEDPGCRVSGGAPDRGREEGPGGGRRQGSPAPWRGLSNARVRGVRLPLGLHGSWRTRVRPRWLQCLPSRSGTRGSETPSQVLGGISLGPGAGTGQSGGLRGTGSSRGRREPAGGRQSECPGRRTSCHVRRQSLLTRPGRHRREKGQAGDRQSAGR